MALKVAVGAEPPSLSTHLLVYLMPSPHTVSRHTLAPPNKDKLLIFAQTEATYSHLWKIMLTSSYIYRTS